MPALNQISLFELDMGFPGWRESYGVPLYWAPDGLDWIALYPAPRGGAICVRQVEWPLDDPTNQSLITFRLSGPWATFSADDSSSKHFFEPSKNLYEQTI